MCKYTNLMKLMKLWWANSSHWHFPRLQTKPLTSLNSLYSTSVTQKIWIQIESDWQKSKCWSVCRNNNLFFSLFLKVTVKLLLGLRSPVYSTHVNTLNIIVVVLAMTKKNQTSYIGYFKGWDQLLLFMDCIQICLSLC